MFVTDARDEDGDAVRRPRQRGMNVNSGLGAGGFEPGGGTNVTSTTSWVVETTLVG